MIIPKRFHLKDLILYPRKDDGLKNPSAMLFESISFQKISIILICSKYVSARYKGKHTVQAVTFYGLMLWCFVDHCD